ncbi:MAG: glycosyltransferase family 39 protein [Acidobacteria bacterium]|nr:glycosyltransferase family 39 protein [Acidobacteriota bacterium]
MLQILKSRALKTLRLPEWVQVVLLAALALALRLLYVFQVRGTSLVVPEDLDPALYYNWGKDIAAGDWIGKAPFVQSPLYAYFLGLLMQVIGSDVGRILMAQAFLGCGTVLLTYVAGRRLFGHRRGLLAGLLLALYGPFIFYEGMVMKTCFSPLLTILLLILLDRAREAAAAPGGRPARLFAVAGAVYGLTTLDRDNFILLAPALALLALVIGGGLGRRGVRSAAAFTLGTILVITPVTLRNWIVSREFVLLTTGGGEVFFIGNNADANGLYVPPPFVRPDPKYEHADFIARASEISGRQLTAMQSSWFWFREGMKFVMEEPLAWGRLLWRKMVHFWNYYELPDNLDYQILQRFSPLLGWLNAAVPPGPGARVRLHLYSTFGTLAPLGLAGIVLTRRSWRRLLPAYLLLFGYIATVMLFFNFSRFRVPIVPILALFAAESLAASGHLLRRARDLAIAVAVQSGEMARRARALLPGVEQALACLLLAAVLVGVNVELPRGVVPAIEQALITGNAYYAQEKWEEALQSYMAGLLLLGEGPAGPGGDELLARFGRDVTRDALMKELEVEAVARGPQFTGIHLGIHHGIGIALLQQASGRLDRGDRPQAMPLLDRAIAQLGEALRLAPSYLLSMRKIARAYDLKGDNATAIEWLRKAVELWPEDLQARFELAEVLFNAGEFRAALREIEDAGVYNKNAAPRERALIHSQRGWIYFRALNEPGRALFHFETALEIDPTLPQAADLRGTILQLRARGYQPLPDDLFERSGP